MTVFVMTRATVSPSPGLEMDPREPPLNARKPKKRINNCIIYFLAFRISRVFPSKPV